MRTLIIIDLQNDFMPGGALAVPNGDLIVPVINNLLTNFDLIIATQDWHPANHKTFASQHAGKKPFEKIMLHGVEQTLWPDHCVQGTVGAEFHPQLETRPIEAIFRKGTDRENDSYSGFYDNQHKKSTGLAGFLREKGAKNLYFCGLCADICVYYTLKDAITEGFTSWLIEDATQPLDQSKFQVIKNELLQQGVGVIKSVEF
ncbi:bifunctional nicotinamidase/pyrazinamidase [Legionella micdadei]|uniref:nicotinamidase n=1 Tax=Legionella micdadei TaxID=451 RepID=A0A098GBH9_LEGMI|nr:bifunctional nicotinamidase/pyrazinamidase [Legionella micdadei]ARG98471.1 nicotinamidase [Legionella micdadei]ARH01216.1 nicotinamidase [Legionella micdadei]KTD30317.1 bifunctional pyrazinamidase/nicotinamidase [Legionella micdadei]CEG59839.1 Pyrazinamidase/nicotinamidase [Legionella micdadei]SCY51806.1 nicotinamidase/pyrazinamidase [Legionella micdadei]